MEIAIDGGPLKSGDAVRGIGTYVRELTKHLKGVEVIDALDADLSKYNLVHLTRFNPFKISVPAKKPFGTKFILTIYDLIPLIYPKHYPPGIKGWLKWQINKYLIRKNIDAIITISETSKKDICRFTGVDPRKVFVTYLAPRSIFRKMENGKRFGLPDRFALYVGDINYNKNIPLLVKACKAAGVPLVIVGKQAADISTMDLNHKELLHLKKIDWDNVIRLGFIEDETLVKIYNLASFYIQPSLYEGFGLPLLEAQAVGLPVVASKTQALIEIAEDSALFTDSKSVDDFANKIALLLKDDSLKNQLVKKGLVNAKKYTWEKAALETENIYKKALNTTRKN